MHAFVARTFLNLANNLRRDADVLAVAHLRHERPALPPLTVR